MKKTNIYKKQYAEAKAAYMQRKDYAIGRGFSQSPEYRAVRRREVSFNYRQRKKEALKEAGKVNPEKPRQGEIVRDIDENLFYLALSGVNTNSSTAESNFDDVKERAKETGAKGVGVVESKLTGHEMMKTCYTSKEYTQALFELFRKCAAWQRENGDYPTIITSTVEKGNLLVAYTYAVEPE